MDKGLLDLLIKVKTGWLSPEYVAQIIEEQNEIIKSQIKSSIMLQEVFTKIENIFSAVIQPEYKVTTDTPRQVSEVTNRKDVVIVTVHTQNHIEVATWLCHLLNSKK